MSTATQSMRPHMERARRAWRGSPLPRFFNWWSGELAALLPTRWRTAFGGSTLWYLLERTRDRWTVRRQDAREVLAQWRADAEPASQQAALKLATEQVDAQDLRIALLLPTATVLRRQLLLPLAAANNLNQVGAFEMDRQTPFRAEQVHYAIREIHAPAPAGRFVAELVAVPRGALDPLLVQLDAAGIAVDAVDASSGDGRLGVNLLQPAQTPQRTHPRRRLNTALAAACLILLLAVLGQWLHNRRQALVVMQSEVETLRTEAQQVAALRQQLQDNAGAAGFLVARKQHAVTMLSVLQDLTSRLPESAWLERFSVDSTGQLGFQGQAKRAAALIDALKDSPLIRDANFQGSIQPDPATGKERFYLVAQLPKPAVNATPGAPVSTAVQP